MNIDREFSVHSHRKLLLMRAGLLGGALLFAAMPTAVFASAAPHADSETDAGSESDAGSEVDAGTDGSKDGGVAIDPFVGAFTGTVFGDNGTVGPIHVELVADPAGGGDLLASVDIGEGLEADLGGLCGRHQVPALQKSVTFTHVSETEISGDTTWPLGRFTLAVAISAALQADPNSVSAIIHVDTPVICPDVAMMVELERDAAPPKTGAVEP